MSVLDFRREALIVLALLSAVGMYLSGMNPVVAGHGRRRSAAL